MRIEFRWKYADGGNGPWFEIDHLPDSYDRAAMAAFADDQADLCAGSMHLVVYKFYNGDRLQYRRVS